MKKAIFSIAAIAICVVSKGQSKTENPFGIDPQAPEYREFVEMYKARYEGYRMAYFPDENQTYVVEKINTFTESEDFAFNFEKIIAIEKGSLPIALAPEVTPGLNFTVNKDKKRKAVKSGNGSVDHYVCAYNGGLCVILWND